MRTPASAKIAPPFASAPDEPTIQMNFPTSPGFSSGANISQQTARELSLELLHALAQIEGGSLPLGEQCPICHAPADVECWYTHTMTR
ncbi:hypothetical protein [Nonomuraea typhae]|uniref:DUF5319 domain-containing protein n=1 Tax=Nonomuraea typhae TaxID=2603600 RepID=A0ABW7YJ87_9ACTN